MLTTVQGARQLHHPALDVNVSGTFSSRPGVSLSANVVYTQRRHAQSRESDARPRPRRDADGTITVNVLEPNTVFGDRIDQLDIRIGKILRFGRTRTNLNLDIVNALNSNDNLALQPDVRRRRGRRRPIVLTARLFRLSAQLDF